MIAALVILATLAAGTPDEAAAKQAFAEVRGGFARRPRADTIASLHALAERFPSTETATRALLWAGDLDLGDHDLHHARYDYQAALARTHGPGELHTLAERGLGDAALLGRDWSDAAAHYTRALDGAPPLLAVELHDKLGLAERGHFRAGVELACWFAIALATVVFAVRIARARGRGLAFPVEIRFLVPLYALLLLGGVGRDRNVEHALWAIAGGSLVLIGMAFAPTGAPGMRPRARAVLDAALLVTANAALVYVALRRADILDPLLMTLQTGPE